MSMLQSRHVNKVYGGKVAYQALSDITFSIDQGELVGVMGPSGSGKTTLLNILSTIDKPTSGEVEIDGTHLLALSKRELALFRRRKLGFVFQDFNLLDTLTIGENILLPLTLDKCNVKEMEERLGRITQQLGIGELVNKRTYEVSGGQAQRTAIARAMIHSPSLLLADEPTGNLDSKAARDVLTMLETLNKVNGTTTLMVTHDPLAASYCHRILFIKDGQIYNEIRRGNNRQTFYQHIVDVLALLGGNTNDVLPIRS